MKGTGQGNLGGKGMEPGTQRARGSSFVKAEGKASLGVEREAHDNTWSWDSATRGMKPWHAVFLQHQLYGQDS